MQEQTAERGVKVLGVIQVALARLPRGERPQQYAVRVDVLKQGRTEMYGEARIAAGRIHADIMRFKRPHEQNVALRQRIAAAFDPVAAASFEQAEQLICVMRMHPEFARIGSFIRCVVRAERAVVIGKAGVQSNTPFPDHCSTE